MCAAVVLSNRKEVAAPSPIEIAPPAEADLGQLFGLAKSAYADVPGWDDRRVLEVLTRDVVFVAREQGQVAGYVALCRETADEILVEQLFVAPGHERRGIGRTLLAYAEGYAILERARSLRIVVEEGNRPARRLHRRSGCVSI